MSGTVRAAGCLLWRPGPGGVPELCLVHRPKYDDWSFPKGKLEPGEELLAAAVREVAEETGQSCRPGPFLATVRYRVKDRPKEVTYWAAEATGGGFTPSREVDALRWVPAPQATAHLSHATDRPLVAVFLAAV
ncbi:MULTISPECIES: NUDIX hydrolase [Streptomyces]|uniref:DNA mismatch repair protein MutT n=2 Tax=Streptomyces TaxID=1883 RepID=A0A100Y4S6_9ACTN|nr:MULTISPECIES: NUDIX hydrolase [Streptomyces]KUH37705.1 DNA mismatch repair protein MutT [Streptomyces kanasensis]UUS31813.1 NUDIX hydrolase [Streptomyces changanensis]